MERTNTIVAGLLEEYTDYLETITTSVKTGLISKTEAYKDILETHLEYERHVASNSKYFVVRISLIVALNGITSTFIETI